MIAGYTPKGFKLIDFNSDVWHTDEWDNWNLIDALLEASLGDIPFPVTGGTANVIELDYTPDVAVVNGTTIVFNLTAAPTGPTTVSVDGGTAYDLMILGQPITAGLLLSGSTVRAVFDGVKFNVLSPTSSLSTLLLASGASGATASTDADNLVISSNVHAGLSILTPNTQIASIYFADPENVKAGGFDYNHASDTLTGYVNGVASLLLTATGFRLGVGNVALNLTGANDFQITEQSANVVRMGSSGATNGLQIDIATGHSTFLQNLTVAGNFVVTGSFTGAVSVTTATGVLPLNRGGTGATDASGARTALGIGALGLLGSINEANWSGADLSIANGGTGSSTAAAALTALGALPTAGGTMTDDITRSGKGIHAYFNNAAMTGGEIFIQATGADPTSNPGDIVFEW